MHTAREKGHKMIKSTSSKYLLITLGSSMNLIASTNLRSENSSIGMGAGPTPLACTRSPQKGWSPKKGTMVVGHYIAIIN